MNIDIKKIDKSVLALILLLFAFGNLSAQTDERKDIEEAANKRYYKEITVNDSTYLMEYEIVDGDTIPTVLLSPVSIVASKERSYIEEYRYQRLRKRVVKVYPYANEVAALINEIDSVTTGLKKKRHQKKYLNKLEKELRKKFKGDLKNLTISEGKILTKLINRQTGITLHSLLKEYKSGITATFWSALGKKFGYDLKKQYDPINDSNDKDIESIIKSIELSDLKNVRLQEK